MAAFSSAEVIGSGVGCFGILQYRGGTGQGPPEGLTLGGSATRWHMPQRSPDAGSLNQPRAAFEQATGVGHHWQ
jgi:hypothetical protein